jgi:hypothetical protein
MVITMAAGQKTGSGEGFCYGDTMAVGKTRFRSFEVFAMVIPWQWGQKNAISKGFCHGVYHDRYQVDVYTHIYSQEGQHLFCETWATPLN